MNFAFWRSILAIEERPLPALNLIGKGEFREDVALTALEGNGAALEERTICGLPLAIAAEEREPEIY